MLCTYVVMLYNNKFIQWRITGDPSGLPIFKGIHQSRKHTPEPSTVYLR